MSTDPDCVPVVVPANFADAKKIAVSVWFAEVGETVAENERLAELLIPGMSIEMESPATGTLKKIIHQRNSIVQPGGTIGWIAK